MLTGDADAPSGVCADTLSHWLFKDLTEATMETRQQNDSNRSKILNRVLALENISRSQVPNVARGANHCVQFTCNNASDIAFLRRVTKVAFSVHWQGPDPKYHPTEAIPSVILLPRRKSRESNLIIALRYGRKSWRHWLSSSNVGKRASGEDFVTSLSLS